MNHTIAEFQVDCEFLNCLINFQITKYNYFYYKIIIIYEYLCTIMYNYSYLFIL